MLKQMHQSIVFSSPSRKSYSVTVLTRDRQVMWLLPNYFWVVTFTIKTPLLNYFYVFAFTIIWSVTQYTSSLLTLLILTVIIKNEMCAIYWNLFASYLHNNNKCCFWRMWWNIKVWTYFTEVIWYNFIFSEFKQSSQHLILKLCLIRECTILLLMLVKLKGICMKWPIQG